MKTTKGDGLFKIRGDKIYVHGTINGKFYRKSIGKEATTINKQWLKRQNPLKVLAELIGEAKIEAKTDLKSFGLSILELETFEVSAKHKKDVMGVFNNKILPAFEGIGLEDIKPIDLISFLQELKTQLSFSRVKFIKNTFSLILDHAVDNEIIIKNPFNSKTVQNVDLSWSTTTEAYTTAETAKMLKEATGWLRVFLDISFKTGIRTGEAMALKWEDFDFVNGLLYLSRAVTNDKIIVEFNKGSQGKNKKHYRTIPLFESTIALLKSYYEVRADRIWLFISKDGEPFLHSSSINNYHLKPFLKEIGVKYKTLYATRRTYASVMRFAGEDLEKVQEVMGHTKGSFVTEKHYITEDILSIQDRQNQAKHREDLFNTLIKSEEK